MNQPIETHQASQIYVRFLNLLEAIKGDPDVPELDQSEGALLDMLARRWFSKQPITVLETMNSGVGNMSQSTVHRRLKSLRKHGLVALEIDEQDNRIKYVEPTEKALAYLDRLGSCLMLSKAPSLSKPA